MKYLIWVLFIATMISMFTGLDCGFALFKKTGGIWGDWVVCRVFPLFSYYRWKDKKSGRLYAHSRESGQNARI